MALYKSIYYLFIIFIGYKQGADAPNMRTPLFYLKI